MIELKVVCFYFIRVTCKLQYEYIMLLVSCEYTFYIIKSNYNLNSKYLKYEIIIIIKVWIKYE